MILILKLIALTSIWVLGLKIVTSKGMLLEKFGTWAETKVEQGQKIFEAVIVCQWCMPSIHSIVGYLFAYVIGIPMSWRIVACYPIIVMGSSLVCGLTWLIYETLNRVHDRNEIQQRYYKHAERMAYWDVEERAKQYNRNKKN